MIVNHECPDCGFELQKGGFLICLRCGSQFREHVYVELTPKEFSDPVLWAQAHIEAAKRLLEARNVV